jgi:hypothetical protein
MSNAIPIPINADGGHLVEPPIVDSLRIDRGSWIVVFIPEERVSEREKEMVAIPLASADGRRIALRVGRLNKLLDCTVDRLVHSGDGNFVFHTTDGRVLEMSDPARADLSLRAYVELTDIAMTAQIAFISTGHMTQAS